MSQLSTAYASRAQTRGRSREYFTHRCSVRSVRHARHGRRQTSCLATRDAESGSPEEQEVVVSPPVWHKVEGFKSGVLCAVAGSVAALPFVLLDPGFLTAQWEWDTDMLAVSLFVFGPVYRYGEHGQNSHVNQGIVLAFALMQATHIVLPAECTPLPLDCGAPFGYVSWSTLQQVATLFGKNWLAFAGAAAALDFAFQKALIARR